MFRLSGFVSLIAAGVCGTLLFWTSQSVQQAEKELAIATNSKNYETESLKVFTTEWDYLNRPARLEKLVVENLDIDQDLTEKTNFLDSVEEIPEPVVPILPKRKPQLFHHVGGKKKTDKRPSAPSTIQKPESENFDALLNSVTKGDE